MSRMTSRTTQCISKSYYCEERSQTAINTIIQGIQCILWLYIWYHLIQLFSEYIDWFMRCIFYICNIDSKTWKFFRSDNYEFIRYDGFSIKIMSYLRAVLLSDFPCPPSNSNFSHILNIVISDLGFPRQVGVKMRKLSWIDWKGNVVTCKGSGKCRFVFTIDCQILFPGIESIIGRVKFDI